MSGPRARPSVKVSCSSCSVLPDGTPTEGTIGTLGTQEKGNSARAVSRDGARVVWTDKGEGGLYLTDMSLGRSVRLDVPKRTA